MPLAALRITESKSDAIYLVSKETNLELTRSFLKRKDCSSQNSGVQMSASLVKELLSASESIAERERLTYDIAKSSGLTHTKLRQFYGFQHLKERQYKVEKALREIIEIQEAVASIANIKEKAVLQPLELKLKVMRIWRKMRVRQVLMWMRRRRRNVPGMLQKTHMLAKRSMTDL